MTRADPGGLYPSFSEMLTRFRTSMSVSNAFHRAILQNLYRPDDGEDIPIQILDGRMYNYCMVHDWVDDPLIRLDEALIQTPVSRCDCPKPFNDELAQLPRWRFTPCGCRRVVWRIR